MDAMILEQKVQVPSPRHITGTEAPPSDSVPVNAIRLKAQTLCILPPLRMAATSTNHTPTNLTEYLTSQPDAYLVPNVYTLQPMHELQATLAFRLYRGADE
jgi:hypothetical protein